MYLATGIAAATTSGLGRRKKMLAVGGHSYAIAIGVLYCMGKIPGSEDVVPLILGSVWRRMFSRAFLLK